jgi:hypothetical protein
MKQTKIMATEKERNDTKWLSFEHEGAQIDIFKDQNGMIKEVKR